MSIIFKDVTYIYNKGTPMEKAAIKGLSLNIDKGEFVVVSGRPGSGRSTFLQLLGGMLRPTSGEIRVDGVVGVVFQFPERQFFEETVYKDLSFPLVRAGTPEGEMEKRVKDALGAVGLDFQSYRNRSLLELSSGEKRKVAIAAIIVLDLDVIALDEPLAGLDGKGRREIVKELKRLQIEMGKTVVVASQDWEIFSKVSDRIFFLDNGTLIEDGKAGMYEKMFSEAVIMQLFAGSLKANGLDLGNDFIDAENVFLRLKSFWGQR